MTRLIARLFALLLFVSPALAASGALTITPAATLDRGVTTVVGQRLEFRLKTEVGNLQTATLNLTRAGRVVGEYAMRRDGNDWTASLTLDLPYSYVATLRLFEAQRVWAGATDLYALEREDANQVKRSSKVETPLDFVVTEGKPGGDTSPWWGIAATMVLVLIVGIGTQVIRGRTPKIIPKKSDDAKLEGGA
jgi:hypothetical protein